MLGVRATRHYGFRQIQSVIIPIYADALPALQTPGWLQEATPPGKSTGKPEPVADDDEEPPFWGLKNDS